MLHQLRSVGNELRLLYASHLSALLWFGTLQQLLPKKYTFCNLIKASLLCQPYPVFQLTEQTARKAEFLKNIKSE